MTGTPANTSVWSDADVYYSTNLSATIPADTSTPFGVDWNLVGILDGSDGFEETRDVDKKDHFGWGGLLLASTRKNFKLTKKFSALEDNAATRALIWPGSTSTAIFVPNPVPVKIAFETRTGGKVRRAVSKNYAKVDVDGTIKDSEEDLTKFPLAAVIFPDEFGQLWVLQNVPAIASIAITPLTLALSLAGANVKPLVATATYTDSTTGVISAQAAWLSATPAKATVDGRYVTGVATGTSNVSATYGGVTSTAPSVATVAA